MMPEEVFIKKSFWRYFRMEERKKHEIHWVNREDANFPKGKGRLAGTAQAGKNHKLIPWNIHAEILQIVLISSSDSDKLFLILCCHLFLHFQTASCGYHHLVFHIIPKLLPASY